MQNSCFNELPKVCETLKVHDKELFETHAKRMVIAAEDEMAVSDDGSRSVYFVLSGKLRVFRISEEGKEITLYRMSEGEMCILSMSLPALPAIASSYVRAEEETVIAKLPLSVYEIILARNPEFRELIFNRIFTVLNQVMSLSEEIAFHSITKRIASKILELTEMRRSSVLQITHEEIAVEIGSAREVVSRTLNDLSKDGVILKTRGRLEVIDEAFLKELAGQ